MTNFTTYKNRWLSLPREVKFEKIYYYMAIIFAFTMPISRAMISFFIIAFPLIWIIEGDFKRKLNEIKNIAFLKFFIVFYIILIISGTFFTENFDSSFNDLRLYLYWLTIFVLATSIKKEWIRHLITAFLFGMLASEIVAYGVYFDLWSWKDATKQNPSPFMMHIDYSIYLAFTSILLFSRIISKNYSLIQKILMGLFFLSTTGNLFLQTGRAGQVAYVVAIMAMFLLHYKFSIKIIIYGVLSICVIYFLAFNFSKSFKQRVNHTITEIQTISSGNLNTSWGIRIAFWDVTYETLKKYPIFGVGVGDFRDEAKNTLKNEKFDNYPEVMKDFISSHHFHNQFLQCAMQMGLIGLFFCIALYFLGFKMAWETKDRELRNIFILFMLIYTIGSFTDPLWNKQFTSIIWVFMISLMIANKKFENFIQERNSA